MVVCPSKRFTPKIILDVNLVVAFSHQEHPGKIHSIAKEVPGLFASLYINIIWTLSNTKQITIETGRMNIQFQDSHAEIKVHTCKTITRNKGTRNQINLSLSVCATGYMAKSQS